MLNFIKYIGNVNTDAEHKYFMVKLLMKVYNMSLLNKLGEKQEAGHNMKNGLLAKDILL